LDEMYADFTCYSFDVPAILYEWTHSVEFVDKKNKRSHFPKRSRKRSISHISNQSPTHIAQPIKKQIQQNPLMRQEYPRVSRLKIDGDSKIKVYFETTTKNKILNLGKKTKRRCQIIACHLSENPTKPL